LEGKVGRNMPRIAEMLIFFVICVCHGLFLAKYQTPAVLLALKP
jgi:hypothetical protein